MSTRGPCSRGRFGRTRTWSTTLTAPCASGWVWGSVPGSCSGPLRQVDSEYRGQKTAPVVSIAFANSGELQIELIQQEDESPSIYKEFTDGGGIGFHHVAFWSEDFDATVAAARRRRLARGAPRQWGRYRQVRLSRRRGVHEHGRRGHGAQRDHDVDDDDGS